jgi:spore maturation protein CgeB
VGCHNGKLAMHERVLELMAAQRPVIINATPQDDLVFGINHNFTPDEDFVAFHGHDADAVLPGLLGDEARRRRLGQNARRRILAAHTWHHRAHQVVDDFLSR